MRGPDEGFSGKDAAADRPEAAHEGSRGRADGRTPPPEASAVRSRGTRPRSFVEDVVIYASRVNQFARVDWQVYFAWVGLMLGLMGAVGGFLLFGHLNGVHYPAYVWNVPFGTFVFAVAISFDTIGHRTVYKEELARAEALVHHITIAAGISGTVMLCLCYHYPEFFRIPAICLIALSIFYSVIDEAMHWGRFVRGLSDRVEMWSHFFIFVGHTIQVVSWVYWFEKGYPGVAETLKAMGY